MANVDEVDFELLCGGGRSEQGGKENRRKGLESQKRLLCNGLRSAYHAADGVVVVVAGAAEATPAAVAVAVTNSDKVSGAVAVATNSPGGATALAQAVNAANQSISKLVDVIEDSF